MDERVAYGLSHRAEAEGASNLAGNRRQEGPHGPLVIWSFATVSRFRELRVPWPWCVVSPSEVGEGYCHMVRRQFGLVGVGSVAPDGTHHALHGR